MPQRGATMPQSALSTREALVQRDTSRWLWGFLLLELRHFLRQLKCRCGVAIADTFGVPAGGLVYKRASKGRLCFNEQQEAARDMKVDPTGARQWWFPW